MRQDLVDHEPILNNGKDPHWTDTSTADTQLVQFIIRNKCRKSRDAEFSIHDIVKITSVP